MQGPMWKEFKGSKNSTVSEDGARKLSFYGSSGQVHVGFDCLSHFNFVSQLVTFILKVFRVGSNAIPCINTGRR